MNSPSGAPNDESLPLGRATTMRDYIGFVAMVFGMFMSILDIQIVSSSISEIQAGLSASPDEVAWVQTSYLIAEVVMIPLTGYLSRALSTRVLFTLSAGAFTIMSFFCALATNIDTMIVLRAMQGFSGGAMIPTCFAASFILFPGQKRLYASAMVGLIATMAPTVGPTLGGYITQWLSWHWLFLINLVPGLLVTLGAWTFIRIDRGDPKLWKGFDLLGLLLMASFLGSLEYVLEEGARNNWFEDDAIRNLSLVSALSGIGFLLRVFFHSNPIVDLRAFGNRNFFVGTSCSFIVGIGLYGIIYILPVYLGRIRHFDSLQIGETMFVTGMFQVMAAPLSAFLARKLDPRLVLATGAIMTGSGIYMLVPLTTEWGFWDLFVPQALRGAGIMFCMQPINVFALGTLPMEQLKNASGLYNLMRNLGGAFGLAGINTMLNDRFILHWSRLAEYVNMARPEMQQYIDRSMLRFGDLTVVDSEKLAMKLLANTLQQQAYVMAISDCAAVIGYAFIVVLLLLPLIHLPRGSKASHLR